MLNFLFSACLREYFFISVDGRSHLCYNGIGHPIFPTEEAVTTVESAARTEAPALDNITLNAYLIPMNSVEARRAMMQLCKDADIDLLSHVYPTTPYNAKAHTTAWYTETMADAAEYGLLLQTRDKVFLDGALNMTDEEIRALARAYADLPGFGGFYVVDEPYHPTPYTRVENILREVCPITYVNVNFLPRGSYPEGDYICRLCDYGGLLTTGGTPVPGYLQLRSERRCE